MTWASGKSTSGRWHGRSKPTPVKRFPICGALAEAQAGLGRVTTPEQMLVRRAREKSGLTQAAFAERIETPVATLRDWAQGRFAPPGGVLCLPRLIVKHPELSQELGAA